MLKTNVETFLGCESPWEEARIVIYGAPFDSTTSFRPGTRFASRTMRGESYGLETYSPYQDLDLEDAAIMDSGDLELCFGNTEMALKDIEARADEIVSAGKLPFMIGGEHLVTLGAVRAVQKSILICIFYILMLIQIYARNILVQSCPMLLCCAVFGIWWEIIVFGSWVSAAVCGRNFSGPRSIPICVLLICRLCQRH